MPRDIVCGATNFAVGDLVVVALPGTTLPGDFTSRRARPTAGMSDGMICSAAELGLGSDHVRDHGVPAGHRRTRRLAASTCSASTTWCSTWRSRRTVATACRCAASRARSRAPTTWTSSTPPMSRRCPSTGEAWPLTVDAGTGVSRFALRPVTGIDPARAVAVVDAPQVAAVRHPADLAGGRRHQLRDARTRPPDARPRPRPDHTAVSGCASPNPARRC